MTNPNMPNVANAPAKPLGTAPKPEMSDKEIRLECIKQAVALGPPVNDVVTVAAKMFAFVNAETP